MMGEFDLIGRYFAHHQQNQRLKTCEIVQSIGDDCAVVSVERQQQLAITTDTLVSGTHFLPSISPADLAHKAVAVNLSDLAAMGATPKWASLALTLPNIDHAWLAEFSESLFQILNRYGVILIGGDTTKGPLSLTLTVQGLISQEQGLFRHKAKVGDAIFVSGFLGDSAAGLALLLAEHAIYSPSEKALIQRHLRPTPRVELGQLLCHYSQCAIDISDGLLADLGHILTRSHCGAMLNLDAIPLSFALLDCYGRAQAEQFALTGGEDYELCFTVSAAQKVAFEQHIAANKLPCYCIGQITEDGLTLWRNGEQVPLPVNVGFDHFR